MTRKKLFTLVNNLCNEMDHKYHINSGGCCFVAAVITEQLELYNIKYSVYEFVDPCHFTVRVSDRYLNRSYFNNYKYEIKECNSCYLYNRYKSDNWNDTYSKKWNLIIKTRIRALFKKYEYCRT